MSDEQQNDDNYINHSDTDFDFIDMYSDDPIVENDRLLPENSSGAAINCGFIGVGGAGGKLAKAFLDIGYNKTLLVNTTEKDQPKDVDPSHFLLLPGADGVGKDVDLGKKILDDNSALFEDALRSRLGKVDWLFVLAGGGGGTGSACWELHATIERYLRSLEADGKVIYIITKPTAQELLNPTISNNYEQLQDEVSEYPHIVLDNEKQLHLLRGKVGLLNMYPAANTNFAKLLHQVMRMANESSPIQSFDSKDLERSLREPGRIFLGSTMVKDIDNRDLGSLIFQGCIKGSPCPAPTKGPESGVLLLVITSDMADNPNISNRLEAATAYVGGRTNTLFSGIYIKERIPGLIAITMFGGMS